MKSREAWLQERQTGIGASEIAAVLGLSKFRTALEVYERKVGELPIEDDDEAPQRRRGQVLQRPIIDEYCLQTGAQLVEYEPEIIRHPDAKFLLASLDAVVKGEEDEWNVDAKAMDSSRARDLGDEDSDELPDDYFYQGHFQNFISRRFKTDFAVELGGRWPIKIFTVTADDEFCSLLLPQLERFWWHVTNRKPVPPDFAHETTLQLVRKMHPNVDPDRRIRLDARFGPLMERYWTLGKIAKKAEDMRDQIKAEVLFEAGDAAVMDIDGAPVIVERQAIKGGALVNYVTKPYVKMNVKFPKRHEHPLLGAADNTLKAIGE